MKYDTALTTAGSRLRHVRELLRRTQSEVASDMGLSAGYYSALERGAKPLRRNVAASFAALYRVDIGWLLTGRGAAPTTFEVRETGPAYGRPAWRDRLDRLLDMHQDVLTDAASGLGVDWEHLLRGLGRRLDEEEQREGAGK